MNMLLHGLPDARIEKGDTIRDPKLVDEGELLLYDRVIANPPFSLDEWGRAVAESDGYGRFRFGLPPKTKGDFAFVQHMVAVLNNSGRLGVVMPHGVLFRGAAEGKSARACCERISSRRSSVSRRTSSTARASRHPILVLNRDKPAARREKVLFIDASGEFEEGSNQNRLRDQDIERIAKTVPRLRRCGEVRAGGARHRDRAERLEPEHQPLRGYLRRGEARIDVAEAVRKLRELEQGRAAAEATMNRYLAELGYDA